MEILRLQAKIREILLLVELLMIFKVQTGKLKCGGTLRADTGIITTPNYPSNYPNSIVCIWLITTDSTKYIELTMLDFDIEPYRKCKVDTLEIKDGDNKNSPMIGVTNQEILDNDAEGGQYCNLRKPPRVITSSSNHLRLWFRSDSSDNFRGLKASYKTLPNPGCNHNLSNDYGEIQTPRYPLPYPSNQQCTWTVEVSQGKRIRIEFYDFEMEYVCLSDRTCMCKDTVSIRDGRLKSSLLIGKYCYNSPSVIYSSSNQLRIHFSSDALGRLRGFKAMYTTTTTDGCGGDFVLRNATFTSPNFNPEARTSYPSSKDCVWTITAPENHYVSLNFDYFDVKETAHGSCDGDYIEIRDGPNNKAKLTGKYCNKNKPSVLLSTERYFYLRFRSDNRRHGLGFRVIYGTHSKACHSALGLEDGRITDRQLWASSTLKKTSHRVGFSSGRLNGNSAWCSQPQDTYSSGEYFQIEFRQIMKVTGVATQGFSLTSPENQNQYTASYKIEYHDGNVFRAYQHLDPIQPVSRFTEFIGNNDTMSIRRNNFDHPVAATILRIYPLKYVTGTVRTICLRSEVYGCNVNFGDGRLHTSADGRISFSTKFAKHANSRWIISPPLLSNNTVYYIVFRSFGVDCSKARLKFSYGSEKNSTIYCGQKKPPRIQAYSVHRQLWIEFEGLQEDLGNQEFQLDYLSENLGSGRVLRSVRGTIRSPRSVLDECNRTTSTWVVMLPPGHRVHVEFTKLSLKKDKNGSCEDFVEIKDGILGTSLSLGKYCGHIPPKPKISSSNNVKVTLHTSNLYTTQPKRIRRHTEVEFEVKYQALPERDHPTRIISKDGKSKSPKMKSKETLESSTRSKPVKKTRDSGTRSKSVKRIPDSWILILLTVNTLLNILLMT